MSDLSRRKVNSAELNDETRNPNGQDMGTVNSANSSTDIPDTSKVVAQQIRAMTGLLSRLLELLCTLMKDPRRISLRRKEEASGQAGGLSGVPKTRFDR